MQKAITISGCAGLMAAFLIGCASEGPLVSTPPTVSVNNFKSLSFWPNRIEFDAGIVIQNNDPAELELRNVNFAVDLFDQELFTDSMKNLKHTSGKRSLPIAFPFHIAMKDVMAQSPDVLAEGKLRVAFRGEVVPAARYGLAAVPFSQTIEIPVPKMPEIEYVGTEGEPLSPSFTITFNLTNTNTFPFTLSSVKTFLVINGKKYSLLHTQKEVELQPGETQPVTLQMETTPGKALSMALNLARDSHPTFNVTGTVTCSTPYGWIYLPMNLEEALN